MNSLKQDLIESHKTIMANLPQAKNVVIALSGLGASYFLYKTLKLYLKKRKFRHIPGPPTRG